MNARKRVTRCCFAYVIKRNRHHLLCSMCGAIVKSIELLTPTEE